MTTSVRTHETTITTVLSSTSAATTITTTMTTKAESKILYVWVPYAFFLLAIFVVLTISFIKHTKRVLRRRRMVLDYMEANVIDERPRICRMFASSVGTNSDRNTLSFPEWNQSASSDQSTASFQPGFRPMFEGEGYRKDARSSHDSSRYVKIPVLSDMEMPRHGHYGLEDSGQSVWFKNRKPYGQCNMAFSFDEDLGRSHSRRVIPEQQYPLPKGSVVVHHKGMAMMRHGYLDVIDSEQESQHSQTTCSSNNASCGSPSVNTTSCDTLSNGKAAEYLSSSQNPTSADPKTLSNLGHESAQVPGSVQSRMCSYCGSMLPACNFPTGTRPKKKPRYRRQSACSDSFEMKSGPDFVISQCSVQKSGTGLSNQSRILPKTGSYPYSTPSERTSSSSSKGRSESGSTDVTTLTFNSRTTTKTNASSTLSMGRPDSGLTDATSLTLPSRTPTRTNSTVISTDRPASQVSNVDRMAKGLEVYTIEMNSHTLRQTSLPDEDSSERRPTTTEHLRRTASDCSPFNHQPEPTSPARLEPVTLLLEASQSTMKDESLSTTRGSLPTTTATSHYTASISPSGATLAPPTAEKHIFWLSGNSSIHQTLV